MTAIVQNHKGQGLSFSGVFSRLKPHHANILAFILLFCTGAGIFGIQMQWLKQSFISDAKDHARLAADIISLNTSHALTSLSVMYDILAGPMGNNARFINYLESVEPFSPEELEAFARESGFAGAGILRADGVRIEGPSGWLHSDPSGMCSSRGIQHIESQHLVVYFYPDKNSGDCIYVGLRADRIEELQSRIGVENTLREISALHGISYARFFSKTGEFLSSRQETGDFSSSSGISIENNNRPVVEVRMKVKGGVLVIGIDATPLFKTRKRLVRYFVFFNAILFSVGALLTVVLYRYQKVYMDRVRSFERRLAREREEAALGRAAAGIAHEIRNPLNSVAMGLQRLGMEQDQSAAPGRKQLVDVMLDEIRRVNRIIEGMLAYSRPFTVSARRINLREIVQEQALLLEPRMSARNIVCSFELDDAWVCADQDLIRQLVANLLSNALDAQADGGVVEIKVWAQGEERCLKVINPCSGHEPPDLERIFEPYFTTRVTGTGLGLAISRRIVKAHGGKIRAEVKNGRFAVTVTIPAGEIDENSCS